MAYKCGHCLNTHEYAASAFICARQAGVVVGSPEPHRVAAGRTTTGLNLRELEQGLPDLVRAHYAIQLPDDDGAVWRFYQIDRPTDGKWAGYCFIKAQGGDELHPVRNPDARRRILEAIAANPARALADYGHQLGKCGVCDRTLTDPESIALGIGPVCAGRLS